jgi:hypothetical protein
MVDIHVEGIFEVLAGKGCRGATYYVLLKKEYQILYCNVFISCFK